MTHDQVPTDAQDGDVFTCSCCGLVMEAVSLAGEPVEWVTITEGPMLPTAVRRPARLVWLAEPPADPTRPTLAELERGVEL